MKKNMFIVIFVGVHVLFIVLHIHKHSLSVQESYREQRYTATHQELVRKKEVLTQQLCALKSHTVIKKFATEKLGMHPIRLTQVTTLKQP